MKLLVAALLFLCAWSREAPGVGFGVTENGLNNLKNHGIPWVISSIGDLTIPNISGEIGSGPLKIKGGLTDIKLSGLALDAADTIIDMQPPDLVGLFIQGISGQLTFNWNYEATLLKRAGTGIVTLDNTDITTTLFISVENERPHVEFGPVTMVIDTFDIDLKGSILADVVDWIADALNGEVKKQIKKLVSNAIVNTLADTLNSNFDKMPLTVGLPGLPIEVNYTFTDNVIVGDHSISARVKGLFEYTPNPNPNPPVSPPTPIPHPNDSGADFQFFLSEYSVNSALYSISEANFVFNISSNMIPASSPIKLDTTNLNALFPNMTNAYGEHVPCDLVCYLEGAPSLDLKNSNGGQAAGNFPMACGVFVQGKGRALVLHMVVKFNTDLSVQDWTIQGHMNSAAVTNISVSDRRNIGNVQTFGITMLFGFVIQMVLPELNEKVLGPGIPLPHFAIVDLTKSDVTIDSGFIAVTASPSWHF